MPAGAMPECKSTASISTFSPINPRRRSWPPERAASIAAGQFGLQRLAGRQAANDHRHVVGSRMSLFQVGDRLACLFLFEKGGVIGVCGQADLIAFDPGD